MRTEARHGSWPSPISAELIVSASVGLSGPAVAGGELWWAELRPTEGGRVQLVHQGLDAPAGAGRDLLPEGCSARTRVHEYGGGAWWLHEDAATGEVTAFVAAWADQRLHRVDRAGTTEPAPPVAISAAPATHHADRWADGVVTPDGRWIVCVREQHGAPGASEARNELVALPTDGSAAPTVLVGGPVRSDGGTAPDFVSCPRLSPDGTVLCWLQWSHPDMPWDATELWAAGLDLGPAGEPGDGSGTRLVAPTLVAGGAGESIAEPRWDAAGHLWFVTDRSGRGELHRSRRPAGASAAPASGVGVGVGVDAGPEAAFADVAFADPDGGECGQPAWVFGQSTYVPGADGRPVAVVVRREGRDHLLVDGGPDAAMVEPLPALSSVDGVAATGDGRLAVVGASFAEEPQVLVVGTAGVAATGAVDATGGVGAGPVVVARPARALGLDPAWFSAPEHTTFATTPEPGGEPAVAHAFFYAPANPDSSGPAGSAPPLLVLSHGGPTSAARPMLALGVQYWTSRGFAVVDVNYRGSTGYGRAFRHALDRRWGIADVDDCIAAARHLAAEGRVDGGRLAIRGGSAGGYTTLCALTFHDAFTAGCSLYGVADLEPLALETHKFESRYLDGLVGPYPEARAVYADRSPIHHIDQLATPLLILQGLEDEVVPPAQAEMMVEALRAKGVPFAYLPFAGEQHGFRQAPNIRRALEAELYFYGRIFGFEPADDIEPVAIENL